jgi:hypothetical protein
MAALSCPWVTFHIAQSSARLGQGDGAPTLAVAVEDPGGLMVALTTAG